MFSPPTCANCGGQSAPIVAGVHLKDWCWEHRFRQLWVGMYLEAAYQLRRERRMGRRAWWEMMATITRAMPHTEIRP